MADNTRLNPGAAGDLMRSVEKGAAKAQVVVLDLGGSGAESLATGAIPVTGTFFQATQPVSGTFWQATQPVSFTWAGLTDAELRANPVPVSLGSTTITNFPATQAVTGTFWQATQPVSFTWAGLTDAELRASPVPVSGPLTDAQLRASAVLTTPQSPPFVRIGFAEVGSGLQGNAATQMSLLQTGAGMAVSQSAGNLVITTGTTTNAETIIRSVSTFSGSLLARAKVILSQRIVNQTFRLELADLVGESLAYTINSTTSVTVTWPTGTNPFTAANVGQSLRLSRLSSVGIPGRYVIASVSGDAVTFTVASFPASGSGTLTVYGWNALWSEYSGTTATNVFFDAARRGWASGNTTATINTTASPGHVGQLGFDVFTAGYADGLVASNTGYQWTSRASRIENIPDPDIEMYLFVIVQNGSTAPASTTTFTMGFIQVEDQGRHKVRIASSDPVGSHPLPVQLMGGTTAVTGTITANQGTMVALPAGANAIGDVGMQVRANATGAAGNHHIVSAATTNVAQIKATAGRVVGWCLSNTTASWRFVKLHNVASATAGAAVAQTIGIPPNGKAECSIPAGIAFATAISRSIVTGAADADTTVTGVADVVGEIFFA